MIMLVMLTPVLPSGASRRGFRRLHDVPRLVPLIGCADSFIDGLLALTPEKEKQRQVLVVANLAPFVTSPARRIVDIAQRLFV